MNNDIMMEHARKVNKLIVPILWILAVLVLLIGLIAKELSSDLVAIISLFSAAAVCTIFLITKKFERVVSFIVILALVFATVFTLYTNGTYAIICLFICVSSSSLYFDKKIYIFNAVMIDAGFIILQLIKHVMDNVSFIEVFIIFNVCICILYFVIKWGKDLINSAAQEKNTAENLLSQSESNLKTITDNTNNLNQDISQCNDNMESIKQTSSDITTNIQEVAKESITLAENITHIGDMINDADEKVADTYKTSKSLSDFSIEASSIVSDSSDKISAMDNQMAIINNAATESVATVAELQKNVEEVNTFLSNIVQISKQTNLLALNASIEAARAGESGRGFAVVAEEVAKLAEQSSDAVNQIHDVMNKINEKTGNVLEKVQNSSTAAQEGSVILNEVNECYGEINKSFSKIDSSIKDGLNMIEKTSSIFSDIRKESESISGISEENSSTTEEMLAAMEEQNAGIETVSGLINDIKKSSDNLEHIN